MDETGATRASDLKHGPGSALWKYWTRGEGLAKWSGAVHKWTTLRDLLLKAGVPAISADGLTTNIIQAVMPGYMKQAHASMEHKAGRADMANQDVLDRPAASASSRALVEIRRDCQLEDIHIVRTAEGDSSGRVVEAYATVFDQPAKIRDDQGHYTEVIDRSAFNDILAHIRRSSGGLPAAVKVLYNHGKTIEGVPAPEFQKPLGKPLFVEPESRGLLTRTEYSKTPLGEEVLELIRGGSITAQSFVGGCIVSDPELRGPGDKYRARNGTLTTVRRMVMGLREYGPVLWAAYTGAEILGVRMALPGTSEEDLAVPLDEECDPDNEAVAAGSVPEDTTTARYHQHALYVLRAKEAREAAGLVW